MDNQNCNYSKPLSTTNLLNSAVNHDKKPQKKGKRTRYYLGEKFPGVYLTAQEAKCLHYLILKYTSKKTAIIMKINFRTVEYYRENIRCKVGAFSKKDLLNKIKGTNFLNYVQHIEKLCRNYYMNLELK